MTIDNVLNQVETTKPSQVNEWLKFDWLSELDQRIFLEVLSTHEKDPAMPETFAGYSYDTPRETALLVPAPFDSIYRYYLEMQIDLANMEMDKYNNSAALFNEAWGAFARHWHRTHMPLSAGTYHKF